MKEINFLIAILLACTNAIGQYILVDDAVTYSEKDQVFNHFAEQYGNRKLKEMAEKLGIEANLHWHVGRHTFISLYYAKTKDLLAAQQFAEHTADDGLHASE